jgi:hypothetical protein
MLIIKPCLTFQLGIAGIEIGENMEPRLSQQSLPCGSSHWNAKPTGTLPVFVGWLSTHLCDSSVTRDPLIMAFIVLRTQVPGYRSRGPGFDSRRYQIFWEVVSLERGALSLVSTTDELLGRNSSGSGLENREYGRGDLLRSPCNTFYPHKLALTSPECGSRSVGIVHLRTKTAEFVFAR